MISNGRLTQIGVSFRLNKKNRNHVAVFECSCGSRKIIQVSIVRAGSTQSCGCLKKEKCKQTHTTHGQSPANQCSREYSSWRHMKARCSAKNGKHFNDYVNRGIVVCERWMKFENFLVDMGNAPEGTSIDRIDNDGNYEPGNCRWSTRSEQQRNRRGNHLIEVNGKWLSLAEAAEISGVSYNALRKRLRRGWPVDIALTQ